MTTKRISLMLAAAGLVALAMIPAQRATAQEVTVRVDTPEFGFRIGTPGYPAPVVIAPAPVYAPPPVVYTPPPVVYTPPPRVVYPPVVYAPPQVIAPRPVYVVPRYWTPYGYWHHRHHHDHWRDDRDRGDYGHRF